MIVPELKNLYTVYPPELATTTLDPVVLAVEYSDGWLKTTTPEPPVAPPPP